MANKMDTTNQDSKDKTGINTLPEYKIRTMKDDLAKAGPAKNEPAPPEKLPIAPEGPVKAPLPSAEELISEKELPKAPEPAPKIEKPKVPILEEKPVKKTKPFWTAEKRKFLIIAVIVIVILILISAFFYWQGTKPLPPSEEGEGQAEPEPQPLEPSASLIPVNETKIISLTDETSVFNLLKQEAKASQTNGTFKRIVILKNPPAGGQAEFLSLKELFQELEIPIPPYTLLELKQNYTLVLYSQNEGRRLGLITQVKNTGNLKTQLFAWEQTMVDDFKNFYPVQSPGEKETETFQDAIYPPSGEAGKSITVRYINLPTPDLALNYTIKNNFLIIGTSKDIMYEIIDKIKM